MHKKYCSMFLAFGLMAISAHAQTAQIETERLWFAPTGPRTESVVVDEGRGVLYASVQHGEKKGDGTIALLDPDGTIIKADWISGLHDPKGLQIVGDRLFVSDITELVEIDIPSATIVKHYPGKGAEFLNDVAADTKGNIYVSDMFTSAVYKLESTSKHFELWMQSPDLENPNGLYVDGDTLYSAGWGAFENGKPMEASKARLLKINLKTRVITPVTKAPLGNLDGLRPDGDAWLVSDWKAGKIFRIAKGDGHILKKTDHFCLKTNSRRGTPDSAAKSGRGVTPLMDKASCKGIGDLAWDARKRIIYAPMALHGGVMALGEKKPAHTP